MVKPIKNAQNAKDANNTAVFSTDNNSGDTVISDEQLAFQLLNSFASPIDSIFDENSRVSSKLAKTTKTSLEPAENKANGVQNGANSTDLKTARISQKARFRHYKQNIGILTDIESYLVCSNPPRFVLGNYPYGGKTSLIKLFADFIAENANPIKFFNNRRVYRISLKVLEPNSAESEAFNEYMVKYANNPKTCKNVVLFADNPILTKKMADFADTVAPVIFEVHSNDEMDYIVDATDKISGSCSIVTLCDSKSIVSSIITLVSNIEKDKQFYVDRYGFIPDSSALGVIVKAYLLNKSPLDVSDDNVKRVVCDFCTWAAVTLSPRINRRNIRVAPTENDAYRYIKDGFNLSRKDIEIHKIAISALEAENRLRETKYNSNANSDGENEVDETPNDTIFSNDSVDFPDLSDFSMISADSDELPSTIQDMIEQCKQKMAENNGSKTSDADSKAKKEPVFRFKSRSQLEAAICRNVIGQKDAISRCVAPIIRRKAGISLGNKPIASFLFCGASGVGKTELAQSLAQAVFGDKSKLLRIDCGELQRESGTHRLLGADPGYLGYNPKKGGILVEWVKNNPNSVILFDEIEKASPDFYDNVLLQLLDAGRVTGGNGVTVDASGTIIIATSNLGSQKVDEKGLKTLGFCASKEGDAYEENKKMLDEEIISAVKKHFKVELINRFDEIIPFQLLTTSDLEAIFRLKWGAYKKTIKKNANIIVNLDKKVPTVFAEMSKVDKYGARNMLRNINKMLLDPIADMILNNNVGENRVIRVKVSEIVENKSGSDKLITTTHKTNENDGKLLFEAC